MIIAPVRSRFAREGLRLDAKFHCSPGVQAAERLVLLKAMGVTTQTVGGEDGLGSIAPTSRTKRVYAGLGETNIPYLRPYDVFDYLPEAADLLSATEGSAAALMPQAGTILQTCSGRNLGPLAIADEYIAQFALSDDMLRLSIQDTTTRNYVFAFLSSPTGQALLTRNKTGGVIDHLSADDMAAVEVPFFESGFVSAISSLVQESLQLREAARLEITRLVKDIEDSAPYETRDAAMKEGWTVSASQLNGRLDAARHDPEVSRTRAALLAAGGTRCGDVAEANIPGRYTRYYVEEAYGRPIVSGRQLLQTNPVNMRYLAARSVDFTKYELLPGMIAFGAEGRADERMAIPVLITESRAGWLANNHVMRIKCLPGTNPGSLFLAFSTRQAQLQVRALSCGSVVDAVYSGDVENIILPQIPEESGRAAFEAWENLDRANALQAEAIQLIQTEIEQRAV
ncbi:hypothetical protein LFT44_21915 (plasmid) [Arthrobacter sp. FW306-05-C]|uniref:hypothetical protein n=1 Tax=Arthrobacter sp. FW306-05-C TaxID=2879620 RepID=UPI001F3B1091|nr:hypothetical protein [Arthrobacter sp. FW306-05-C]UKA69186.1 hypothetical protein LFT44_21915 [Arthrobacter sp. FW306-05-C]